ncbi:hypothetical protein C6P45_000511 [Maudiozyma exigua]|uniref:CAP-Gly domain-containing protein n=1 Tax=Maudiozyma exigua TaxID=34358 RepID=A0A9P6W5T9_MAUEX|nr:hypothetical protein C6P45_000511 [Kazachstania exigua]
MIELLVTSDLVSVNKSFVEDITLTQLCAKLHTITGIEPNDMKLKLIFINSQDNGIIVPSKSNGDDQIFSQIDLSSVKGVHVEDTNENSMANQLKVSSSSTDNIGFKLSEEEYLSRSSSVLQWKKENQLGRFDPNYIAKRDQEKELQKDKIAQLIIGERCSVKTEGQPERRGWLRFIGKIPQINNDDIWCGIEFDEPSGKNDGSHKGVQYFGPVTNKYGAFVKINFVETGKKFTPFEIDFSDSDDEI